MGSEIKLLEILILLANTQKGCFMKKLIILC